MADVLRALRDLLADARRPAGRFTDPGEVGAACSEGLVHDLDSLGAFLYGRLWTAGAVAASAAAAVCARSAGAPDSLWRTADAEMDARIPSPAARQSSRDRGGRLLDAAMEVIMAPVFDAIGRASVSAGRAPHYPVVVGAVAALADGGPRDAAEAAAFAYVAGPAFAAGRILNLDRQVIVDLGTWLAPDVRRLAAEAAATCLRPLAQLPSFGAPALGFLAEAEAAGRLDRAGDGPVSAAGDGPVSAAGDGPALAAGDGPVVAARAGAGEGPVAAAGGPG